MPELPDAGARPGYLRAMPETPPSAPAHDASAPSAHGAGRRLAVGVLDVGDGAWAARVATLPGVALAGLVLADASAERAGEVARRLGGRPFASATALAGACDAVVVAGPTPERAAHAATVLEHGAHAFVAWPPAAGPDEAAGLAARAEEAGVEAAVERPLPTGALVAARPPGWAARLVHLDLAGTDAADGLDATAARRLAGALDLCATLCGSHAVARLDAEADRAPSGLPRAMLLALRFANGAYAQVALRDAPLVGGGGVRLRAAGPGARLDARAFAGPACVERDGAPPATPGAAEPDSLVAFLGALVDGRRPAHPLSILDAVATLRLAEQATARLR